MSDSGLDIAELVLEGVKRSNDPEITRILLELALIARQRSVTLSSLRAYVEQLAKDVGDTDSLLSQQIMKFLHSLEDK